MLSIDYIYKKIITTYKTLAGLHYHLVRSYDRKHFRKNVKILNGVLEIIFNNQKTKLV